MYKKCVELNEPSTNAKGIRMKIGGIRLIDAFERDRTRASLARVFDSLHSGSDVLARSCGTAGLCMLLQQA